jgi:hypothetical protein
VFPTVDFLYYK